MGLTKYWFILHGIGTTATTTTKRIAEGIVLVKLSVQLLTPSMNNVLELFGISLSLSHNNILYSLTSEVIPIP